MADGIIAPRRTHLQDLTGRTFGRWTVLSFARPVQSGDRLRRAWFCQCTCGTRRVVAGEQLASGCSMSCGCARNEKTSRRTRKHGHTVWEGRRKPSPEYKTLSLMKDRCLNEKNKSYPDYGGLGIVICDRWLKGKAESSGFECFLSDMGFRPSARHSIDRYPDTSGPYSPENCRWATPREQVLNRTTTLFVTIKGVTKSLSEWVDGTGLSYFTVLCRLNRKWPPEDLLKPAGYARRDVRLTIGGETHTLTEWAEISGIPHALLHTRRKRGWPSEDLIKPQRAYKRKSEPL